jgi:uncharacterized protein
MSAWAIELKTVQETPRRYSLAAELEWWETVRAGLGEPEARMLEPLQLEIDGHRLGRRLLFRGQLAGSLALPCSRCLDAYEQKIEEPFELLLEPASDGSETIAGGIELDSDDPEIGRYAGEELDFGPAVLEMLALAWPMQPLCEETCRGLCASCGTNRNLESCSCEAPSVTRPFAGLRGLLEQARRRDE